MRSILIAAAVLFAAQSAQAAEISWKGGARAVATTGCAGRWDPLNDSWYAYYFFPLAGTTNGSQSTFALHDGRSSEAFQVNGLFSSTARDVTATHIYTRAGQYPATFRFTSLSPAQSAITTSTKVITGRAIINKWDNYDGLSTCSVAIEFTLLRNPE
jgi:hypothetical protein